AIRTTAAAVENIEFPAIAHWREHSRNHFVVVCSLTATHAVIADPASGRRKLSLDEFHRHWSGVLVLLRETPQLREIAPERSCLNRLWSLLLPQRHLILDAFLAAVLMTILGLVSSFFIQE